MVSKKRVFLIVDPTICSILKKTLAALSSIRHLFETGQLLENNTFRALNFFNNCELAIQIDSLCNLILNTVFIN